MNLSDIMALRDLIDPEAEELDEMVSNPNKGSVFAPGDIGDKKQKEIAKPHAKMEVKLGEKVI
jgi:hypothetical protein